MNIQIPSLSAAPLGPETNWVEFKAFAYEGRDRLFEQAPPSAKEYYNPILTGFYPDPSICRAGNDYYLINSSFAYFPGVPIFHSTDLVNWTQIGHVLDRPSQLNLDGTAVSQGVFAPAITYHDGLFYMITTGVYSGGNFVVTAKNPAGPWSEPMPLKFGGIDPSIFFDDDGKAYIVHNGEPPDNKPLYSGHRAVWMREWNPKNGEVSNGRIIVNGGVDISQKPSWIEGPHIFKRNGWYYLTCAEGGTGPNHSQVIFRTRSLNEPFVPGPHNPILTQRNLDRNRPNPVTALGHADLVETQNGEWWAVFLGIRPYGSGMSNLGRETFLLPVTWENDWPTILEPGKVMPRVVQRPNLPAGQKPKVPTTGSFSWSDEFNEKQLGMQWMFLRNPRETWWSLAARPGSLLIAPRNVPLKSGSRKDLNANHNPSFIARRQQHHDFSASLTIAVNPTTADSEAGLAELQNNTNYFFFGVRIQGGKAQEVFLEQNDDKAAAPQVVATSLLPQDAREIELRMEGAGKDYDFSYRLEGGNWTALKENVDGSLLARDAGFVGAVLGPYVRTLSATGNTVSAPATGAPATGAPATGAPATRATASSTASAPARNPVIWADVPDITMIRVADTYYMSSTTMHLSPGLPIMKSRDLVNWQIVSYAYDTLADNDALTLQDGKNAYGQGSWASSLRYHNGTFYVSTFSSTTGKTHIYTTKDIEKGQWTEISFRPSLHDHSLFFDDDGRVYMLYGGGNLRLTELNTDLSGIKPGGINQIIVPNASLIAGPNVGLQAEGSQLVKHDGKYYLFNITWPRGGMRTVIVHRADKITGPYEGRVALHDKGVAQGSLIDTPQGEWFAYLFRDYGAVGRIPYLVPVKWENGWPVLGVDGKVPDVLTLPASKGLMPGIVASDDFNRRPEDPTLPLVWQWNHNPDGANWSLTERPGYLRLKTGRVDKSLLEARNSLTQRTFGPECAGTVSIDVSNMKNGDFAGLAALQKNYGFVGVKMVGGAKSIVMVDAGGGLPKEVASVLVTQTTIYLKVAMDYKNRADRAYFSYSLDGKNWRAIGSTLKMTYTLPHFMGYRFALCNYATETAGGFVDFDYFAIDHAGPPRTS